LLGVIAIVAWALLQAGFPVLVAAVSAGAVLGLGEVWLRRRGAGTARDDTEAAPPGAGPVLDQRRPLAIALAANWLAIIFGAPVAVFTWFVVAGAGPERIWAMPVAAVLVSVLGCSVATRRLLFRLRP